MVKKKKTNSRREFTSTLTTNTPSSKIWKTIKRINGKPVSPNMPIGDHNTTKKEKANLLLEHFNRHCTDEFVREHENELYVKNNITIPLEHISLVELKSCLTKIKNTSPGDDQICNVFLKKAPDNILMDILYLFNTSLTSGSLPTGWKKGTICAIPKPMKDPSLITSHRPITMLSCVGKLMERIVKRRIEFHLEQNHVFTACQSGFRRCRGTTDILSILKHVIHQSREKKEFCIVTYLDLEGAYDCVWHKGLIKKLNAVGLDETLINWLGDYLTNRKIQVRVGTAMSDQKHLVRGLPQGAVLSPTLFNVMLHDLPTSDTVKVLSYADDITLVTRAKKLKMLNYKCNNIWINYIHG